MRRCGAQSPSVGAELTNLNRNNWNALDGAAAPAGAKEFLLMGLRYSDADIFEIRELRALGMTASKIAARLGRTKAAVKFQLHQLDQRTPTEQLDEPDDWEAVCRLGDKLFCEAMERAFDSGQESPASASNTVRLPETRRLPKCFQPTLNGSLLRITSCCVRRG